MGLPILIEALQEVRRKNPSAAGSAGFLLNLANMVCLDEFLALLSANLGVLAQFKAMLNGLIVTASETVGVLNVIVAQLETANSLIQSLVQAFGSLKNQAISSLVPYPFLDDNYLHCPPVQAIKDFVTKLLPTPDPSSLLPGNAKRYVKKYKSATQSYKELEYRLYRNQRKIQKLRKKIEEIQIQILCWQAIVDAIEDQFGV